MGAREIGAMLAVLGALEVTAPHASSSQGALVVATADPARTALPVMTPDARQEQPRSWQSDVRVQALDVTVVGPGGALAVRVAVAAEGDAAREARLEILLPIGVAVLRFADGCRPSPSPVESLNARITCTLGDVAGRTTRAVAIMTTAAPPAARARFAVFAFSDTPDPVPSNNFAERVIP
jgi:hypothetical protein